MKIMEIVKTVLLVVVTINVMIEVVRTMNKLEKIEDGNKYWSLHITK